MPSSATEESDKQAIKKVCEDMYKALSWSPEEAPDWDLFRKLFVSGACLGPAARPVSPVDVETFVGRMSSQRDDGSLTHFTETQVGVEIAVFGNVATAQSSYHTLMNEEREARGVNALLLVNDAGWKILAMAWDSERDGVPIPSRLGG